MFSAKFNFLNKSSKLPDKTKLSTLNYAYNAQPFVLVVSKNQNTYSLDTAYSAQPFVGVK